MNVRPSIFMIDVGRSAVTCEAESLDLNTECRGSKRHCNTRVSLSCFSGSVPQSLSESPNQHRLEESGQSGLSRRAFKIRINFRYLNVSQVWLALGVPQPRAMSPAQQCATRSVNHSSYRAFARKLIHVQELGSMYDYLAKIILLGPSGSGKYYSLMSRVVSRSIH